MTLAYPIPGTSQEEEWLELQSVLKSGILDRAPNLRHFLEYVAEQHFSGKDDQVKEYSIAVQALHRLEHFDSQSDTIVRVTAHTLRKKLEQYYAREGADHPIQIRLPAGKYILQFERREQAPSPGADRQDVLPRRESPVTNTPQMGHSAARIWVGLAIAGAVALLWMGGSFLKHIRPGLTATVGSPAPAQEDAGAPAATPANGNALDRTLRIHFGATSHPYLDVAGQTWRVDQYCHGGSTFSHLSHEIQGTDDPELFRAGREGKFQCRIPVPAGTYQLQLLFADTAGDKEGARQVDLSINNAAAAALDIVDEAGGDDVVVGKVFAGIHPMSDGAIHLDFSSDQSFVNAAELTPYESNGGLPLRMLAGPAIFRDEQGKTWLPERFFQGGRRSFHPDNLPKVADSRLFEWARYGRFHYLIPVVAGKEYRVRLYFSEAWFGSSNGGPGGVGSRMFDVYLNGTTLLKNFDILSNQKNGTAVITFNRVKPTVHGMLELYFTPVKNYPLINAIEVEPEG
jgi:hypothetical protein